MAVLCRRALLVLLLSCGLEAQDARGNGAYHAYHVDNNAAGQVPNMATLIVSPPKPWGSTPWATLVGNNNNQILADGTPAGDRLVIELSGLRRDIPFEAPDVEEYAPFNPNANPVYNLLSFPGQAGQGQVPTPGETKLITSSPPCLFAASVAPKGVKLTLYLLQCATNSIPFNLGFPVGTGLLDAVQIFLPWYLLATNPARPQVEITTQATFSIWSVATNSFTSIGPVTVSEPLVTTAPQLALSALQFFEFYPGGPNSHGRPPNTIAKTDLEEVTVTLQLGVQLSSGNRITLVTSVGPIIQATTPPTPGADLVEPTNVLWASPESLPARESRFLVLGPTCSRSLGSCNCCSQSYAEIQKPTVSWVAAPEWWISFVITLGPAGCVIPADKRFTFIIPRVYLGKNPSPIAFVPTVTGTSPGFYGLDIRVLTSAETRWQLVQRFSESYPFGYKSTLGNEPVGLVNPWRRRDLILVGGPSSYVVGHSTVRSLKVNVDTTTATIAPRYMEVSIVVNTGLKPLTTPATDSPWWIVLNANQGVFRSNIAAIEPMYQLGGQTSPGVCAGALFAFTTAYGTLMVGIRNAACLTALSADGSLLAFQVPATFLLSNPSAGTAVKFDVRIVPPLDTVNAVRGPLFPADSASLMNVYGYTTVADCTTVAYNPGPVGDIAAMGYASRCLLIGSITDISPVTAGFFQCSANANVNNAQNKITLVKIAEGVMTGDLWPGMNVAPPASSWPQNVAIGGSPPLYITSWGFMLSTPMFAVVVSYPPTWANIRALGLAPAVNSAWQVAFIVKMDRITVACSIASCPSPWTFCVAGPLPTLSTVLLFPSVAQNKAGVAVDTLDNSNWQQNRKAVCVTVIGDGAVAGWYATGVSPVNDDDSDGAWYAFFAFFALPILLLCCCLLAYLLYLRRREAPVCCPDMPMYPVQETYWQAGPANPAPMPMYLPAAAISPAAVPMYLTVA